MKLFFKSKKIKFNNFKLDLHCFSEHKAFTLIEMLVATVLFLLVMIAATGIFLSTIRGNARVNAMQKVENEVRYIVELISKEIRLGTINYDYYQSVLGTSIENPVSVLAIKDNADNKLYFALNADGNNPGIIQMSLDEGTTWSDLNTGRVVIDSLDFYLLPSSDPFSQGATIIKQPLVILNLKAHYDKGDGSSGQINIQTAISSRQYKK